MANNTTQNPLIATTTGVLKPNQCKIENIEWKGVANSTDQVIVQDTQGRIVWQHIGGDDSIKFSGQGFRVRGIQVTQIDSGTLLVYLR